MNEKISAADSSINVQEDTTAPEASNETQEADNEDTEGFARDGVEVVDVKVIPKLGIPHGSRNTWDKI